MSVGGIGPISSDMAAGVSLGASIKSNRDYIVGAMAGAMGIAADGDNVIGQMAGKLTGGDTQALNMLINAASDTSNSKNSRDALAVLGLLMTSNNYANPFTEMLK